MLKRAGTFQNEYETSYFFVSDIGLHARLRGQAVRARRLAQIGRGPVRRRAADRQSLARRWSPARPTATANALLEYELKADQVLTARSGKDVSLLPFNQPALDLSDFAVAGRQQDWFDVFAWSGRDLYRPGETVRLSALLRDFDGKPIKPQPLFVTPQAARRTPVRPAKLEPKELGYYRLGAAPSPRTPHRQSWQVEFRPTRPPRTPRRA